MSEAKELFGACPVCGRMVWKTRINQTTVMVERHQNAKLKVTTCYERRWLG